MPVSAFLRTLGVQVVKVMKVVPPQLGEFRIIPLIPIQIPCNIQKAECLRTYQGRVAARRHDEAPPQRYANGRRRCSINTWSRKSKQQASVDLLQPQVAERVPVRGYFSHDTGIVPQRPRWLAPMGIGRRRRHISTTLNVSSINRW